jgi:hypothetical protein
VITPRALAPTTPTTETQSPESPEHSEHSDDLREQVWTLHLRGVSMRQIALRLTLNRKVVARLLGECEREFAAERRARLKRKLEGTIARMRHVQSQAWDDHDADDEREQASIKVSSEGASDVRFQSQRSQYLRVALDAEKEIARLEGLYADDVSDLVAVLFSVERVVGGVVVARSSGGMRRTSSGGDESGGGEDG